VYPGTPINSVSPCTEYLTFGPWVYLVPQFKPKSVLMLGYAKGTVAELMRLLYGEDFPITAIDIASAENDPATLGVEFVCTDARDYLDTCGNYEVIIVDLWEYDAPEFIFTEQFVQAVASKCDYLIVHCMDYSDMSAYAHLPLVRVLGLDYGAKFYYYMINRVARAPFRGRV